MYCALWVSSFLRKWMKCRLGIGFAVVQAVCAFPMSLRFEWRISILQSVILRVSFVRGKRFLVDSFKGGRRLSLERDSIIWDDHWLRECSGLRVFLPSIRRRSHLFILRILRKWLRWLSSRASYQIRWWSHEPRISCSASINLSILRGSSECFQNGIRVRILSSVSLWNLLRNGSTLRCRLGCWWIRASFSELR